MWLQATISLLQMFDCAVCGLNPDSSSQAFILKVSLQDVWFYCGGADRWRAD